MLVVFFPSSSYGDLKFATVGEAVRRFARRHYLLHDEWLNADNVLRCLLRIDSDFHCYHD